MRNDIQDIGEKLSKRNAELIRNPTIKDLINKVNITKIELDLKCINGAQIRSKIKWVKEGEKISNSSIH